MIRSMAFGTLCLTLLLFSGCATMIRGTSENLMITSDPSGAKVELSDGRDCRTPCQMKCKRNQTLVLKYTKDGYQSESLTVCPTLAGAGVILGGVIDYGTGAVYNLEPNPAHVILNPINAAVPLSKPAVKSAASDAPAATSGSHP